MRATAKGNLRRMAICLACCALLYSLPGTLRPPPARAQLGAEAIIGIVGIVVGAASTAVGTAATLATDKPAVHIDEFSLAVADDFNVGDHGTVNLQLSVSYGNLKTNWLSPRNSFLDHVGHLKVEFFADGQKLEEYSETVRPNGGSSGGQQLVTATIVGVHPGSTNVTAKITVSGWEEHFFGDEEKTLPPVDTPVRVLNVKEPYTVWIVGPLPPEIPHGDETEAKLMVLVRTEDYGVGHGSVGPGTKLDGESAPYDDLPGAANAGASYVKELVSKKKRHDGCAYNPPHPPFVNLEFKPNGYRLWAFFFAAPYDYPQTAALPLVFAKDYSRGPPPCLVGEVWNPDKCKCEPTTTGTSSGTPKPTPGGSGSGTPTPAPGGSGSGTPSNQPPIANPGGR